MKTEKIDKSQRPCCVAGCTKPRESYINRRGILTTRSRCKEHQRQYAHDYKLRRKQLKEDPEKAVEEHKPARCVIFDLSLHKVFMVKDGERSVQDYPRDSVNPNTIKLLEYRDFLVEVVRPELERA